MKYTGIITYRSPVVDMPSGAGVPADRESRVVGVHNTSASQVERFVLADRAVARSMAGLLQFVLKCAGLLVGIEAPQTHYFKVDMVIVYNHFHVLFIPMRNAALHDQSRPGG